MRYLHILIAALVAIFAIHACDSSKESPVASSDPTAPAIMQPQNGADFVVTEQSIEDTLFVMEWQEPDFGFQSAPTYSILMSLPEQDIDPIQLSTTNQTEYTVMAGDVNNRLLQEGARAGEPNTVRLQVRASVADSLSEPISEPRDISIQPVFIEIEFPEVFAPGNYQAAAFYGSNWTPADAPPLASENSDDVFRGFIPLLSDSPEFKITPERNWDADFGADESGTLIPTGPNITAPESGVYWMVVDLNAETIEMTKTEWGLIGDAANGWGDNDDIAMTYLPEDKIWTVDVDLTAAGEFKFRANQAWDINFGDNDSNGTLEFGGANLSVDEDGNYTVQMDLSNPPRFTVSITKN